MTIGSIRWAVVLLSLGMSAQAAQVCTVQRVGNDEFRGISGESDANIFAVAKKGTIYRYDGSSWNSMSSDTNEDLNDVEVIGSEAFAVGKDGEVVYYNGSNWSSIAGFTGDDLFGVWAASSSEVWVGGKNGELWFYDGSTWTDVSGAANTDNDDITDLWGDANTVYAINEKGELYRYNRSTGNWYAPNTDCDAGDKFEDLWGDGLGNVYLAGKKEVYVFDGSTCAVASTASEDLFGVSGWSNDGSVIAVGKKGTVFEYDGSTWSETQVGNKELQDAWVSPNGNAYYAGKNKELTTCTCTDCAVGGTPEFVITHDSYGIHCQAETLQVLVRDGSTGTPLTGYTEQITLDTQSGFGSWSLTSGGGSLVDASPNDGLATYAWPSGESTATFSLYYPEGAATIDVDVFQSSDTSVRDTDTESTMTFSASGFTVTAGALPNPPPGAITPFNAAQTAGTDFLVHIAAYGQTPTDPSCGIIESYTGGKNLEFWLTRQDPAGGTITATIDTAAIGVGEGAATPRPVTFTNGQAQVTAKYKDVGRIQLSTKDTSPADPDLASGIRGATSGFVVKPAEFRLSNIVSGATPNPGAADASGNVFIAAGETFSATVTALDAEGSVTPNYGQETIAEGVSLSSNLVAPTGGNNPSLGSVSGFGAFSGGSATGTDFSWPEVGIITLTPSVGDGDYLGAGDVSGLTSGNVGRFIPHHFETTTNVPAFGTGCVAGSFTYIGESFSYTTAPVITFTAKALGGATTQNYDGDFFRMTGLAAPTYTSTPATLDTSGLPGIGDPAVASSGAGVGTLTFSSGSGFSFTRGAEQPEFDADIRLSQVVADADGAAALSNPVEFGNPGGLLFDAGAAQRYGRARILNAFGSERVNLAVTLRTEYYVDASTGFVPNVADACSTPVTVTLDNFTDNLAAGETCVLDNGSPGLSGSGCTAVAAPSLQFREPSVAGDFNLNLQAPGDGNDGSARINADVPAWLEFDWDASSAGFEDPTGNATFGIFQGQGRQIYTRELY